MTTGHRQTTLDAPGGEIERLADVDWTFEGADTKELTHGLHRYPARMIPQIPRTLLAYFRREGVLDAGDVVFDPFLGSGTTAVEARLAGLHAVGTDVNPLGCLLTRAKARPVDVDVLDAAERLVLDGLADDLARVHRDHDAGTLDRDVEGVRDGWFPEPQLYELVAIRDRVDGLATRLREETGAAEGTDAVENAVRLLRVALSSTTRRVSYQRPGEFKRYRIPEDERADHDPDVLDVFTGELADDVERARAYSEVADHSLSTTVHYADARSVTDADAGTVTDADARTVTDADAGTVTDADAGTVTDADAGTVTDATTDEEGSEADPLVAPNTADAVITSPPYGDHGTTVAYGQFSQDPAIVAGQYGYDEMKAVDRAGLGGADGLAPVADLQQWSPALAATVDALRERDGRATDALSFFTDYFAVMEQVAAVLKPGQPVAWVVANRTMSRVPVPTHLVTRELCEHLGFVHETTLPREIPTKTLPWENAPENVAGRTGDLMAEEHVVVLRAPD